MDDTEVKEEVKEEETTPLKEEYQLEKVKIKKSEGDTKLLANRARNSKYLFNHSYKL